MWWPVTTNGSMFAPGRVDRGCVAGASRADNDDVVHKFPKFDSTVVYNPVFGVKMQMRCCCLSVLLLSFAAARAGAPVVSGDAFVRFDPATTSWTCGTRLIEQRLELAGGKFRLAALRNKLTGTEYTAGAGSDEFRFVFRADKAAGRAAATGSRNKMSRLFPCPRPRPESTRESRS